ncbi:MAG TPA: hypothetical protein VH088_10965, partial [Terriglobales bacterium]|nr:hypothetical protein [Terriglobales bacterium]
MRILQSLLVCATLCTAVATAAEQSLPPLHDGGTVAGPGEFRHDGELKISGKVALSHLTLNLHGPIVVDAGATLELTDVHLLVSDPPDRPNGTSGLRCLGPAVIKVKNSTTEPVGTAHPMWLLKGKLEVANFQTKNAEFHLDHAEARIDRLKIFELEVSHESQVTANGLDLVFLSTHTSDDDHLQISDIPVQTSFSKNVAFGSGARADLRDTKIELFLVYVHGQSKVSLSRIGKAQLAMFPQCRGKMHLPKGMLGTEEQPVQVPASGESDCPFQFSLNKVNVDTWDVYADGQADLTFDQSRIDELVLRDNAKIRVTNSEILADWLGVSGDAQLNVEDSTVGA